jgi:hypothetical protein
VNRIAIFPIGAFMPGADVPAAFNGALPARHRTLVQHHARTGQSDLKLVEITRRPANRGNKGKSGAYGDSI